LYYGYNLGDGASGVVPDTCPDYAVLIDFGDTGDIGPVFTRTNPGQILSVIVSAYSPSFSYK
jgi:hypothetical protein